MDVKQYVLAGWCILILSSGASQDTQRQMQGEPTAAQQADGAKVGSKAADKDC